MSRSLRARGLKWTGAITVDMLYKSRSLRARGLKLYLAYVLIELFTVALFTGAWIEIQK